MRESFVVANKNKKEQSIELKPWPHDEQVKEDSSCFSIHQTAQRIEENLENSVRNKKNIFVSKSTQQKCSKPSSRRTFKLYFPQTSRSLSEKKTPLIHASKNLISQRYPKTIDCSDIFEKTFSPIILDHFFKKPSTTQICHFNEKNHKKQRRQNKSQVLTSFNKRLRGCSSIRVTSSLSGETFSNHSMIKIKKKVSHLYQTSEEKLNHAKRQKGVNSQHFQKMLKFKQKFSQKKKSNVVCKELMTQDKLFKQKKTIDYQLSLKGISIHTNQQNSLKNNIY